MSDVAKFLKKQFIDGPFGLNRPDPKPAKRKFQRGKEMQSTVTPPKNGVSDKEKPKDSYKRKRSFSPERQEAARLKAFGLPPDVGGYGLPAIEMGRETPLKNGVSDKKKLLDEAKRRRARAKMHPSSGYSLPNEQVDAYTPTGLPISSGQVDPRLPNLSIDNESQAYGRVDAYTPTDPSEEARRKMSRYTRGTKQ